MRRTREVLETNLKDPRHVDAVIISHMHGDHINHHSLRVIEEYGLTVWVYERCLNQLKGKHFNGHKFRSMDLKTFSDTPLTIGDLWIQPFEVPHQPTHLNCGFAVRYKENMVWKSAVIITDFHNGSGALGYLIDSDFIFLESNHDPDLLARYFNPNSRFHLSNPKSAELLHTAYIQSSKKPKTVMLGHLSSQRNTEQYALKEVQGLFQKNGTAMDFQLCTAPLQASSVPVEIA
jgi:phosphoribosyl 1,2-cyclic phosphodiesterase